MQKKMINYFICAQYKKMLGTGPASECTFFAGLSHKKKSHSLSPLLLFNFCIALSYFLGLLFIVSVAGCTSLHLSKPTPVNPSVNENDIFVDPVVAHYMGAVDRMKLQTLIATAQPQQAVQWYSSMTGERLEFTSFRIYVNAQGQGCRNYRIALNRGLLGHRSFNYTACRDNQGVWKVSTP
ncbi:MAG: hypothetical protein V4700_06980 [Pseudomonadota bacterium]